MNLAKKKKKKINKKWGYRPMEQIEDFEKICCPNGYLIYDKDAIIYNGEKIWTFIGAVGKSWEIKIKEWN